MMNKQRRGAAIAAAVGLLFVALEIAFNLQTAMAGIFILGMAGGLLVGDQIGRSPSTT